MPIPKHNKTRENIPTRPPVRRNVKRKPRRVQSKYPPRKPPVNEATNRRKRPKKIQKVKRKPRKVVKKPKKVVEKPKVRTGKYNAKNWITITFLKSPIHTFFPSNIFPEAINSQRMNYQEAKNQPDSFWVDKKIIFHMADRCREDWLPFYTRVIGLAKIAWIKFAAKTFMTYMIELDRRRYRVPLSFYRVIDDACDNILWELPLDYGGFWNNKNKVPLTLYDKKFEVPVGNKSIDFLAVIDKYIGCNHILTLELMRKLSQAGYRVKVILIKSRKDKSRKYNGKTTGINIIPNNKNSTGQAKFHDLCRKSKIMIDLSFRWTYGRVVYEALFNGALSVCTHTYGASHHLFPDLIVDTANPNIQEIYEKCVDTIKRWSPELVLQYRKQARHNSSPQVFAQKLNEKTNRLLNNG